MDHEDAGVQMPITRTARQRARAQVTKEILGAARRQLESEGAAGISLRAVARELGMPSSGIYRYFATRDELLTRLIIEAYDSIGAAAEASQRGVAPPDLFARFAAACRAVRRWALDNPHEYSLVYGWPVPNYQAPEETVRAASRVTNVLGAILTAASQRVPATWHSRISLSTAGREAIAPATGLFNDAVPPERVQIGLMIWMALFGTISFELYGHLLGAVRLDLEDRDAFFESCVESWADEIGFA